MRFSRWALLVACVLVFAGHVCVLPLGEAHEVTQAGERDGSDHDGLHAASCEAVNAPSATAQAQIIAAAPVAAAVRLEGSRLPDRPAPSLHRPPRFLLHAALLI